MDTTRESTLWRRFGARGARDAAVLTAGFIAAWLVLDIAFNVRFPGNERKFRYLLPSIDATALLAIYGVVAALGRRVPRAVTWVLVGAVVFARVIRIADGIDQKYFYRDANVYLDARMVPEAVRLLHDTVPAPQLALGVLAVSIGFATLVAAVRWALSRAEQFFRARARRLAFAGAIAVLIAASPLGPSKYGLERYSGMFASSIVPRLGQELRFAIHARAECDERVKAIRKVQTRLASTPKTLDLLHGVPVFVFIIEAYGVTLFDPPLETGETRALFAEVEARLHEHGYSMASTRLRSPVYGGHSWLAQITVATGVQTGDDLTFAVLKDYEHVSLASFFRSAGYRTVLVQPGTTRRWPERGTAGFDRRYASWDFDYRGPRFSWALMPDQYVLDFIHSREVKRSPQRLFVEYALVSSHAPWTEVPTIVDDWSKIGDGAIFDSLSKVVSPTGWLGTPQIRRAYIGAIRYDLSVLSRYLDDVVGGDALVIVLGDHQPLPDVTGYSEEHEVPVHAISRDPKLLAPLMSRGFASGLVPPRRADAPVLATLMPTLLEAYSSASPGGAVR